ncbi:MAG: hypothetical protein HC886_15445 [Leptolyngbyaceae cyanobacterium SM1_1_3]|nr:hypothetical protein [Leptolyngbyaceae cyanobacterium SM1_1_3]
MGSTGQRVIRVQNRLKALKYLADDQASDGVYGGSTQQAVVRFQQVKELPANGVADTATLNALFAEVAPPNPDANQPQTLEPGDRIRLVNDSAGGIAVYSEPNTDSRTLSTYASGAEVVVRQITDSGWIELSSGGWVRQEFAEF